MYQNIKINNSVNIKPLNNEPDISPLSLPPSEIKNTNSRICNITKDKNHKYCECNCIIL